MRQKLHTKKCFKECRFPPFLRRPPSFLAGVHPPVTRRERFLLYVPAFRRARVIAGVAVKYAVKIGVRRWLCRLIVAK